MKLRARRRRWKTRMLIGLFAWKQLCGARKVWVLRVFKDVGCDEHNGWDEYLVMRFK